MDLISVLKQLPFYGPDVVNSRKSGAKVLSSEASHQS